MAKYGEFMLVSVKSFNSYGHYEPTTKTYLTTLDMAARLEQIYTWRFKLIEVVKVTAGNEKCLLSRARAKYYKFEDWRER